ncbi:protein rep [Flavobacterium sp. MR2016-29]|uniref:protein rep n=1 Tax=Flavobacterium sp. MR2016-29 TaxID=2783795 RepID=UPI00188B049B|nr:protein rep [Flavobacterium sp. MR2016-29]MBF4491047.1 protein rep [Flavobacterium sp. MR2016-29]
MQLEQVLKYSILHNINYSSKELAQIFDNQYFNSERYPKALALDNNTDLVRHINHPEDISSVYKTLLHRMRNIAKQNYTIKETKEKRKPRIQFCGYSVNANSNQPVRLCKNDKGGLFFNGVANCGGYWRCPVCALKISENKKELLSGLINAHQLKGFSIGFLTLTVRHSRFDTLKKSLEKISKNYRSFQNQRFFSRNKIELGFMGQVKTLEITYSMDNGWHPHLHILFFYNHSDIKKIEKFQKEFISKWFKYQDNNGTLGAQNQKILTADISNYLAKYDITSEMTKGQIKSSKGLTPFTALAKIACGDFEGYMEKHRLYGIYSCYVEETQGKHFVNISNSLRTEYSQFMEEFNKTDEEIVNQTTIDEVLLKVSLPIWKLICKNDLQPLVLIKYKENNLEGVYNLLKYFRDFNGLDVEIDKDDIPILTFGMCELPKIRYPNLYQQIVAKTWKV